jgi:hypothetical protein
MIRAHYTTKFGHKSVHALDGAFSILTFVRLNMAPIVPVSAVQVLENFLNINIGKKWMYGCHTFRSCRLGFQFLAVGLQIDLVGQTLAQASQRIRHHLNPKKTQ